MAGGAPGIAGRTAESALRPSTGGRMPTDGWPGCRSRLRAGNGLTLLVLG